MAATVVQVDVPVARPEGAAVVTIVAAADAAMTDGVAAAQMVEGAVAPTVEAAAGVTISVEAIARIVGVVDAAVEMNDSSRIDLR